MKKYLFALLLSFSLVGYTKMSEMGQDVKDGMNEIKDDLKDYGQDMKDDIHDSNQDMSDDVNKDSQTQNAQPTSFYGLDLDLLWTVPSFCNATIGKPVFRGY